MSSKRWTEVFIEVEAFNAPNCFKLIVTTKRIREKYILSKSFGATKREKEKNGPVILLFSFTHLT